MFCNKKNLATLVQKCTKLAGGGSWKENILPLLSTETRLPILAISCTVFVNCLWIVCARCIVSAKAKVDLILYSRWKAFLNSFVALVFSVF
jgi:threonine/homoserine/homoserine lactone efflux protein